MRGHLHRDIMPGIAGVKWSIGAYGGCQGTQTNRPILRDSGTAGSLQLFVPYVVGDGRIADLDLEGNGTAEYGVAIGGGPQIAYQITMFNLLSNGNNVSYAWAQGAQIGLINSVMTGMRTQHRNLRQRRREQSDRMDRQCVQQSRLSSVAGQSVERRGCAQQWRGNRNGARFGLPALHDREQHHRECEQRGCGSEAA
jgi:hypothetical protein